MYILIHKLSPLFRHLYTYWEGWGSLLATYNDGAYNYVLRQLTSRYIECGYCWMMHVYTSDCAVAVV